MLPEFIKQFKIFAPLQMPELISSKSLETEEIYENSAQLTYVLTVPMTMERLLDIIEDANELILFYHMQSDSTQFGQRCCAFSLPNLGHMYKINVISDDQGMCSEVYVTIYESLEYMGIMLREELALVAEKGRCAYKLPEENFIAYLC